MGRAETLSARFSGDGYVDPHADGLADAYVAHTDADLWWRL